MTILQTRSCKSAVLTVKRQDLVCKIDVKREKNWRLFFSYFLTLEDHRKPSKVLRLRNLHRIMISYKCHYTINEGFEEKSTQTLNPFVDRNRARNGAFYGKNRLVLRSFLFQGEKRMFKASHVLEIFAFKVYLLHTLCSISVWGCRIV